MAPANSSSGFLSISSICRARLSRFWKVCVMPGECLFQIFNNKIFLVLFVVRVCNMSFCYTIFFKLNRIKSELLYNIINYETSQYFKMIFSSNLPKNLDLIQINSIILLRSSRINFLSCKLKHGRGTARPERRYQGPSNYPLRTEHSDLLYTGIIIPEPCLRIPPDLILCRHSTSCSSFKLCTTWHSLDSHTA